MEEKIIEEFERRLEDEELDCMDFENLFDEIFDDLYPGSTMVAAEYVNLRHVCSIKFLELINKEGE